MADKKTIGAKIVLDGEAEYRKSVQNINATMRTLSSELKLATAEFKNNANSTEALSKKSEVLKKQMEAQAQKVNVFKDALENSNSNLKKTSDNVQNWRNKLSDAETKLNSLKNNTSATSNEIREQEEAVEKAKNALKQAESQYGTVSNATLKWEASLNDAQAVLFNLDGELQQNEKYLDEAKRSANGTAKSIDEYGKEVKGAKEETSTFGDVLKANLTSAAIIGGIKTLASTIKSVATSIVDVTTSSAAYADDILTMSTQTRMSTDALQAYAYAADLVDVSLETLTGSMAKQIKSMSNAQNGSENYVNAYKELRVEITDTEGKLRDSDDVYWDLIDALGEMTDETKRDTLAMQLFGKSAQDLNPLIAQGSKGIAELASEAKGMGAILDEDALSALGDTDDAIVRMNQSLEIAKRKFGVEMAPVVQAAMAKITQKASELSDKFASLAGSILTKLVDGFVFLVEHGNEVRSVLIGIATALVFNKAIASVTFLIKAMTGLKAAITAASVQQGILNALMTASPTGLLITALAGVTVGLIAYVAGLEDANSEHSKFIEEVENSMDAMDDLNNKISENKASLKENKDLVNTNAESAQVLADKLYALAEKENLSNAEKQQMKMLVSQLNDLYPDLGLSIDETTGKLNKQKITVDSLIESYKKQALQTVYQEQYTKAVQEYVNAVNEQKKAEENLSAAKDKVASLNQEDIERYKTLSETITEYNYVQQRNGDEWKNLQKTVGAYLVDQEKADEAFKKSEETLGNATNAVSDLDNEIANMDFTMTQDNMATFDENVALMKDNFATGVEEIKTKYQEMYAAAEESLQGQVGLFDEFTTETDLTKKDLQNNLQSQVDGIKEWSENITKISETCSSDFVKYLAGMGLDSAAEVKLLSSMTKDELVKYEATWKEKNEAISGAAKTQVGDMKDDILALEKELLTELEKTLPEYQDTGNTLGSNIGQGVQQGIRDSQNKVRQQMIQLAKEAMRAARKELDINSPSRVARKDIGQQVGAGWALGLNDELSRVESASKRLSNATMRGMQLSTVARNSNIGYQQNSQTGVNQIIKALGNMKFEVGPDGMARMVDTRIRRAWT